MGKDRGEVTNIKNFVNQIVFAPTASPCREQTACGMISPNMTIPRVAPITATTPPPPVRVSRRTVRVLLTRTLPRRIEQSRKFPIPRIGMIAYAHIYYLHIQSWNICLSVCLFFVSPIITQEPFDRLASIFYWETSENHGNVLSFVLRFKIEWVNFYRKLAKIVI